MGIDINTGTLLHQWINIHAITGPLLTLGVQHLDFTWAEFSAASGQPYAANSAGSIPTAREFFDACGIPEALSLDISGYEGADFLFDLNNPAPPENLSSNFGLVLNGGTIEHVFNIPHALTAITRMLRPGGLVIHIVPVHNWVEHGFYQINPTLLFDYYTAARFDILESVGLCLPSGTDRRCEIVPIPPGALAAGHRAAFGDRAVLCMFVARKTAVSLDEATPTQSSYAGEIVHPPPTLRWFAPYSTLRGMRSGGRCEKRVLGPFSHEEGLAWLAALSASELLNGDSTDDPYRSALALFEDDRLLGPAHTAHAVIRHQGGGSYSHWRDAILLSSSDGSDPNHNGRKYTAIVPLGDAAP